MNQGESWIYFDQQTVWDKCFVTSIPCWVQLYFQSFNSHSYKYRWSLYGDDRSEFLAWQHNLNESEYCMR